MKTIARLALMELEDDTRMIELRRMNLEKASDEDLLHIE